MVDGAAGTGHVVARDGRLLRVDMVGNRWVATRFDPGLAVHDVFYGSEQQVRAVVEHWRAHG
jgi:hypothetical protein